MMNNIPKKDEMSKQIEISVRPLSRKIRKPKESEEIRILSSLNV